MATSQPGDKQTGNNTNHRPIELGFHLTDEEELQRVGVPEWVLVDREIGHDPWNRSGSQFQAYSNQGIEVICRLNHGEYPHGTLPFSQNYAAFARRCANFVAASSGCHIWVIGNEPNFRLNWPTVPAGSRAESAEHTRAAAPVATEGAAVTPAESGTPSEIQAEIQPGSWWQRLVRRLGVKGTHEGAASTGVAADATADPAQPVAQAGFHGHPAEDRMWYSGVGRFNALRAEPDTWLDAGAEPGTSPDFSSDYAEVITPRKYIACYRLCRRAIRAVPGHEQDLVLVAGVAPWTTHATYAQNPTGDWTIYFQHLAGMLSPRECDGFAWHLYVDSKPRGSETAGAVGTENATGAIEGGTGPDAMGALDGLAHLKEQIDQLPDSLHELSVYVTEFGPIDGWDAIEAERLSALLQELTAFSSETGGRLRVCLLANRHASQWALVEAPEVLSLVAARLRPPTIPPQLTPLSTGSITPFGQNEGVVTTTVVNLRRSAGYLNKPPDDIVGELAGGVRLVILSNGATARDGLRWWQVRVSQGGSEGHTGWVAEATADGQPLLVRAPAEGGIRVGGQVRALMAARIRRSRGYLNQPDDDVLGEAAAGTVWRVVGGPASADSLTWWEIDGTLPSGSVRGWVAETAPGGLRLLVAHDGLPQEGGTGGTPPSPPAPVNGRFRVGDRVITLNFVRLRRTPGIVGKGPEDVVTDVWQGIDVTILEGPHGLDDLVWYRVETAPVDGQAQRGWMAESAPGGIPLLGVRDEHFQEEFDIGELVTVGASALRVRRSPGTTGKQDDDVLGEFYPRSTLNILSRATQADGLRWWLVGGIATHGPVRGWVAQATAQGIVLVRRPVRLPGTNIPDRRAGRYLHRPFEGRFGISQLWGENPAFYSRFTYDGAPLRGHNGIDFLTPVGTPILAVEAGTVSMTGFEPGGFGHFVLLDHAWGQSIYAHLDAVSVAGGQSVGRGQRVGASGNTGNSTGPHLHFAIRIHPYVRSDGWGGYADPLPYMAPGDVIMPGYVQAEMAQDLWPQPVRTLMAMQPLPPSGMAEETPGMVRP